MFSHLLRASVARMTAPLTVANIVLAALLCGCSPDNPLGRREISGDVQLDGVPLDQDSIRFDPMPGVKGTSSGGVIEKGKYKLPQEMGLPDGTYRVSITSSDKKADATPVMGQNMEPAKERIDAKFNSESDVTVDVKAGATQFDFKVKSASN